MLNLKNTTIEICNDALRKAACEATQILQGKADEIIAISRQEVPDNSKGALITSFTRQVENKIAAKRIATMHVILKSVSLMGGLLTEDPIATLNNFTSGVLSETVSTSQPPEHLGKMMDLCDVNYVEAEADTDEISKMAIARGAIRDIVTVFTTGAPSTLANVSLKGASIEDLSLMQEMVTEIQDEILEALDKEFGFDSAPLAPRYEYTAL